MKKLSKIYRVLLMFLPVVLYFSYFPVISLGRDDTMNFELSLPLIYLVMFDVAGLVLMGFRGKLLLFVKKWVYLLFPIFASLSILWSSNIVRGVLTAGIMWALFVAVFAIVALKDEVLSVEFRQKMIKVFLGASLLVCAWCVVQCILDIAGVSRDVSLMCEGCVSVAFGFPHPNGFAIEPQFMGNLLLAPAILVAFCILFRAASFAPVATGLTRFTSPCQAPESLKRKAKCHFLLLAVFATTLFLTLSRGAIYAFVVAMVFMTVFLVVGRWKKGGEKLWKKLVAVWSAIILSFVVALNVQGVMAEVGPTNDTYQSAVAKVLNHLSLGIIDFREKKTEAVDAGPVVASVGDVDVAARQDAIFDGYVEESTNVRAQMTHNALVVWGSSFKNVMVGVGLGGAGRAMQEAGVIDNADEIVQNQYVSLLLETGVVGVGLVVLLLVLAVRLIVKMPIDSLLLTLMVAYGVSLCFFAGLPNALHIYLMPVWVWAVVAGEKNFAKQKLRLRN